MKFAKITVTNSYGKKEMPVYIYEEDEKTISYIRMDTAQFGKAIKADTSEKVLKGYTAEAKKLTKEYVKAMTKAKELEMKAEELKKPYYQIKKMLTNANGELTAEEFFEELQKNGLDISGSGYTRVDIYEGVLNINYTRLIEKYFGESSITKREYDGCLFMINNAEKTKLGKSYMNKYRCSTNIKKSYTKEWLDIGDKETLYYMMDINVKLTKPMTADYAKELTKKLIG